MKYFVLIPFFLVICILFPYFYFYLKLKNPKHIVKPSHGEFAELRKGKIFYQRYIPEKPNGEKIILVHGFSTPSIVWKGVIPFMIQRGYEVIAYDHYGRGFSQRPKVTYTKDFYISTLKELVNYLKIDDKFHLVGYSMGGPIVGYFANEYPEQVSSVNLIAPAGYMFESKSSSNIYLKILNLPLISQYISIVFPSLMYGGNSSIKLSTDIDKNKLSQDELNEVYKEQMLYEGFTRSLLSTAKNFNLFNTKKMYQDLGKKNINASVIWGNADEIVSIDGLNSLKIDIPHINSEIINDGHHDITYAMPSTVGKFLVNQISSFSDNE